MTKQRITTVTLEQAKKRKGKTDWKRIDALTDAEINRAAAEDPDSFVTDADWWRGAKWVFPRETRKESVTVRLDPHVIGWFRQSGRGYQTRINAVLRAFVESRLQARPEKTR